MALFHSFSWMSNIPLYICIISSSIPRSMEGCFHVLTTVNSASMNTGVLVSFGSCFSPDRCLVMGICIYAYAGSYGGFIPSFLRISIQPSTVAGSIYTPTNSVRGFPSLHTLSSIYCKQSLLTSAKPPALFPYPHPSRVDLRLLPTMLRHVGITFLKLIFTGV